jgi:hypothetical protein
MTQVGMSVCWLTSVNRHVRACAPALQEELRAHFELASFVAIGQLVLQVRPRLRCRHSHLAWLPPCLVSWLPLGLVTAWPGYRLTWLPLGLVTAWPGYHLAWLPPNLVTTWPGYHCQVRSSRIYAETLHTVNPMITFSINDENLYSVNPMVLQRFGAFGLWRFGALEFPLSSVYRLQLTLSACRWP